MLWVEAHTCVSWTHCHFGALVQVGIDLPEPQQGRLLDLAANADATRAVAALQVRSGACTVQKTV